MSTQTITTYLCDPCLSIGNEVQATATRAIAIDAYQVKVDLCAQHDAAVMDALRTLIGQRGDDSHICEWCGYIARNSLALATHKRRRADHAGARSAA